MFSSHISIHKEGDGGCFQIKTCGSEPAPAV